MKGALGEDIDVLFVTGGLAAEETRTERQPDAASLKDYVSKVQITPTYAIGFLR